MHTVRLIVRYDGTGLSGWQRQRGVPTVQAALETAASAMSGEQVVVRGSGRTDAGVHALAQVASFQTSSRIPAHGWRLGLNGLLPTQVAVTEARFAQDDFDPRRASAGKRYRYVLLTSPDRDPLMHHRAWHLHGNLDLQAMAAEASELVGEHDFRAFRAADCERRNTVRHIFRAALLQAHMGRDDLVAFEIEGTAFLKNMVRVIVGTLVDVGRGRLPSGTVRARLADGDRTRAGMTAPPHGLYLAEVFLRHAWRLPDDRLRPRPDHADAVLRAAGVDLQDTPEHDD